VPLPKHLAGVAILIALVTAGAEAAFPKPRGKVNDFAGVLDTATAAELARLVRDTEARTSAEIAVVTVPSLDGMSVEEYAVKLFAEWGIGKSARDNGVLVLVAPAQRRMRIEVGYGLEPILPDALAGRIIREEFLPAFRDDQYGRGILQGVRRVADVIVRRETVPADERRESAAVDRRMPVYLAIPFLGVFVVFGAFIAALATRTRTAAPLILGGLFLAVGLLIGFAAYPGLTLITLVPLGAVMAMVGYRAGAAQRWVQMMRGSSGPVNDSTAWIAASGDGSSGGGGSSGGDSSGGGDFGGGDSGGGGASGSW
jgi:uncharacterized protein